MKDFVLSEYSYSNMTLKQKDTNLSEKSKAVNLIKYMKDEVMAPEDQTELKVITKNEKKNKKNLENYHIFSHDSGRLISLQEYERLIKNII